MLSVFSVVNQSHGFTMSTDFLQLTGKRILVMGVANDRSIAWGIARILAGQGAELAFTYQGGAFGRRAVPLRALWTQVPSRRNSALAVHERRARRGRQSVRLRDLRCRP